MNKKVLISIILLTMISCSNEKDKEVTVSLLHYFTGNLSSGVETLSDIIDTEEANINLVATPLDHEEFKVGIRVQLDSSNPPDLFTYWAGARTNYLAENDKILPITSLFQGRVDSTVFDESILEACSYNGEIYLLPITRHYVGFFYNKEIFNNLGIVPPENWEEFLDISRIIKESGISPYSLGIKNRWPGQFWFDYILLRTAGYDYREGLMNNSNSYRDKEVINAIIIWKDLIDRGYFQRESLDKDWDYSAQEIAKGRSAMTLMGTWVIPLLKSEGLEADVDYGFFPFPQIEELDELVSLGPIDGILVSNGTKNINEAKEILYHLAMPETQEEFNSLSGAIAPQKNADSSIYNSVQLEIKELMEKSSHWSFNYDLASTPIVSEAGLDFFAKFLNEPEKYEDLLKELDEYITDILE